MTGSTGEDPWEQLRSLPMGQHIEVTDAEGRRWVGTVIPHHELSGDRILQIKLESGYNVGLRIGPGVSYRLRSEPRSSPPPPEHPPSVRPAAPGRESVTLLTTGGTIASRVDYETGGVRPVRSESELLEFYPDLDTDGPVHALPVLDRLSENIVPEDWAVLAEAVRGSFATGSRGVVIAHGTDTLGFTAAALAYLLPRLPGPVALVGAQRSPDRPSSDGRSNLRAAVRLARSRELGEVVVVMHAGLSDDRFAIHRGTRVRKMHSTRRDAFRSPTDGPLGYVDASTIHWVRPPRAPHHGPPTVDGPLDPSGALLWFYPGLSPTRAEAFVQGHRGIVLAGTGLGHIAEAHLDWIRRAVDQGTVVAMTTQCLAGAVDPYVYATGRDLVRAGVTYLGDMLPETAYVKLLWALGHEREAEGVRKRLLTPTADDLSERRRPEEFE